LLTLAMDRSPNLILHLMLDISWHIQCCVACNFIPKPLRPSQLCCPRWRMLLKHWYEVSHRTLLHLLKMPIPFCRSASAVCFSIQGKGCYSNCHLDWTQKHPTSSA
jgi:hypothetical protein